MTPDNGLDVVSKDDFERASDLRDRDRADRPGDQDDRDDDQEVNAERFQIRCHPKLLAALERVSEERGFMNRSEGARAAIRAWINADPDEFKLPKGRVGRPSKLEDWQR